MTTITISRKELKDAVKESVREVLSQELISLRALLIPLVSKNEQRDIEKRYVKPTRKTAKTITIEL
ncbi:MAG: hypothetical protein HY800_04315 [Ignavibacteriales bacterium]|nr:hypothetical protein [Ignavibacteriales bacterium]